MKRLTLFLVFIFNSFIFSQSIAITENGDSVILYNDGTWEYFNEYSNLLDTSVTIIDTNKTEFMKPENSKKVLKGQKTKYELWYNGDNWKLTKSDVPHVEYMLSDKYDEKFCMVIPERVPLSMEALKEAALANAKSAATDVKVLHEEIRKVNNSYVLMMKFRATIQGIDFIYLAYYYSDVNSSIQLITLTTENLIFEHENELINMLNGLVF